MIVATEWQDRFNSARLPAWLAAFAEDPATALDDLLWNRFPTGTRGGDEDAVDRLLEWAATLGNAGGFLEALDEQLASWVRQNWNTAPTGVDLVRRAIALRRAFDVIAVLLELKSSAVALRERLDDRGVLHDLSTSGVDPLGRYLNALGVHQRDRSLEYLWRGLSTVPADTPWYHARYAVSGIAHMPATPEEEGSFRREIVDLLLNVVGRLTELVADGSLPHDVARRESTSLAGLVYAAYPFPEEWRRVVMTRLPFLHWLEPTLEEVLPWVSLAQAVPSDATATTETAAGATGSGSDSWTGRAIATASALRRGHPGSLATAEQLIDEQRAYAATTGDVYYLVRSLCNFAQSIWDQDPARALEWVRTAFRWDPANLVVWGSLASAVLRAEGPEPALPLAWEATAKFPENTIVWSELSRVLRSAGRFGTAALANIYGLHRFSDPYFAVGLAETFAFAGRELEAAQIYVDSLREHEIPQAYLRGAENRIRGVSDEDERRRLVALIREIAFAKPQLSLFAHRFDDVGSPELRITATFPLWGGDISDLPDSPPHVEGPSDAVAGLAEARLRRRTAERIGSTAAASGLLTDAEAIIESALGFATDSRAATEGALLALARLDFKRAATTVSDGLVKYPGSAGLKYTEARLRREQMRGRRVDDTQLLTLRRPWIDLRETPSMTAVSLLGEARACAAVRNGGGPEEEASRALRKLFVWIDTNKRVKWRFQGDWATRVDASISPLRETGSVGGLPLLEHTAGQELNEVEEDFAARAALAV